ncbi:MAG: hypothetical protein ACXVHY_10475, partial [Methanobacterium sp.]
RNIGMERNGEYVSTIIVNIIFLYIFNNLLNWHVYFVTSAFNDVLWIINLSIAVAIIGNFLMLLYRPEWFRHVTKIVLNIVAFAAVYLVYIVFPFNFSNSFLNWGLSVLLILAMIGIIIATIVEIYLLITGKQKLREN